MTYDDQYLVSVSEDACVIIWKVQDKEGHAIKRDKEVTFAEEILITKSDLEEKVTSYILSSDRLCFSIVEFMKDIPVNKG